MARIKINLPHSFLFNTTVPVRITDLNYGGHVGNDALLGIIHEIRMQFLKSLGYSSELEVAGSALIMS
ncbi:MAG: thioesterase, partial [Chitinophagaceae bacterium]